MLNQQSVTPRLVTFCYVNLPDPAVPASINVAVIRVLSTLLLGLIPLLNVPLRFSESCIGTTLAMVAVHVARVGGKRARPGATRFAGLMPGKEADVKK